MTSKTWLYIAVALLVVGIAYVAYNYMKKPTLQELEDKPKTPKSNQIDEQKGVTQSVKP